MTFELWLYCSFGDIWFWVTFQFWRQFSPGDISVMMSCHVREISILGNFQFCYILVLVTLHLFLATKYADLNIPSQGIQTNKQTTNQHGNQWLGLWELGNLEFGNYNVFQCAGKILTDIFGPFPEWLGWIWYLLVQFTTIMGIGTSIVINMVRVFLIKKVTTGTIW